MTSVMRFNFDGPIINFESEKKNKKKIEKVVNHEKPTSHVLFRRKKVEPIEGP